MAVGKEYSFTVDDDDDKGQAFGPVSKENIDIARFLIDFSCWLDTSETIAEIDYLMTAVQQPPQTLPPWQADYPLDTAVPATPPDDLYPLTLVSQEISTNGLQVILKFSAGTPGLAYVVSFAARTSVSGRRRQVDILLAIDQPLNPAMVSPGDVPAGTSPTAPLVIGGTTALPLGFNGRVYVENASGGPITVTLPPSPTQGQLLSIVDINGNADANPITFKGNVSDLIYGANTFVTDLPYDDIRFEWTGSHWIMLAQHYGFLG